MKRTSLVAAALGLLLLCCAGSYNSQEQLTDRVNHFNNAVRWGQYHKASQWIAEDARVEWLAARSDWRSDLRIADYEVVDTEIAEDGREATVRVVISWYRLSQSELQTTMLSQTWRRQDREWILASEELEEGEPLWQDSPSS